MNTDVIASLKRLWQDVFGDTEEAVDSFFSIAYAPDRCMYHTEGGQAVSALYWLDCQCRGRRLAYIYAVATDPKHRGKGLASRLLRRTHARLKELGYAGAVLKPADGLFPFYERLGYVPSGFLRRFDVEAGSVPAVLKELTPAEYAAVRRTFLPENAVIQEGITLEFLHTYARFFAGDEALVCVTREENIVLEYLGDPGSAPGILSALGIRRATLPTPGSQIPFTMYCALDDSPVPGYLGIALE